ncbi:hypothetical protein SB719_22555, partial [Pantoea sp. SIMBA_079]
PKPMLTEHVRRSYGQSIVGGGGGCFHKLALDLVELLRRDPTKANSHRESTIPLLSGVGHGLTRHPVISERLKLREVSS